jgi:hypothetical protein
MIKIFRRSTDGQFPKIAELTAEDQADLTTPLLPGFTLRLSDLFAPSR